MKKKTQEKGKIIKVHKRKMIRVEERGKCPFPDAEVGDSLHFEIRNNGSHSPSPYEFITDISENSLRTERINFRKLRIEKMNYPFEEYIYSLGDFYDNSISVKSIKGNSSDDYKRIKRKLKRLGVYK